MLQQLLLYNANVDWDAIVAWLSTHPHKVAPLPPPIHPPFGSELYRVRYRKGSADASLLPIILGRTFVPSIGVGWTLLLGSILDSVGWTFLDAPSLGGSGMVPLAGHALVPQLPLVVVVPPLPLVLFICYLWCLHALNACFHSVSCFELVVTACTV